MTGSSRNRYVAGFLTALAVLAVAFGLVAYSFQLGNISGFQEAEAGGYAAEYPEVTAKRMELCSKKLESSDRYNCMERAIASGRDQQRDEYDLNAQRNMAEWAFWLLVVSSSGLLITSIGTFALYVQIKLTGKAIDENRTATKAATDANAITQKVGEAQARAYLSVTSKDAALDSEGWLDIVWNVVNSGLSPARNVQVITTTFAFDKGKPIKVDEDRRSIGDLAAGSADSFSITLDYQRFHKRRDRAGGLLLQVSVRAAYSTVFNAVVGDDEFVFQVLILKYGKQLRVQPKEDSFSIHVGGRVRKTKNPFA